MHYRVNPAQPHGRNDNDGSDSKNPLIYGLGPIFSLSIRSTGAQHEVANNEHMVRTFLIYALSLFQLVPVVRREDDNGE